MPLLADHFGLVGILVAVVSSVVAMLSRIHPPLATRDGARSVGLSITAFSLVLAACGWAAFLRLPGGGTPAETRRAALGGMVGLAVAAVAVRAGARLEQVRLDKGPGTPGSRMAARAAVFFFLLSLAAGALLRGRARVPLAGSMCAVWIPALYLWRKDPGRGPMDPAPSAAWRASFFGLAVTALSSLAIAAFQERFGPGALTQGLGWGVGGGAALLLVAAWVATRLAPGRAVGVAGLLSGVAGVLLRSL
jgi:hypothetical protein